MIDLNYLKIKTHDIFIRRVLNGANLKSDHLKHCAEELIEATESRTIAESVNADIKDFINFQHELADVIICVLNEAYIYDIDIEKAINEVVDKNEKRALGKGDKK